MTDDRFQDQNYRLTHFQKEVAIVCPKCQKKALTTVNYEEKRSKLTCTYCGYHDVKDTSFDYLGHTNQFEVAANLYFKAELWYMTAFKNEFFFAYNEPHLLYLEKYIAAKLRENKDRKHFTLLEKLPRFYHEAKNREALLKIIQKLKVK